MISKQLFCKAIESIMNSKDYQNEKMKLWKKYGVDGYIIEPDCDAIMLRIIKESFNYCESTEAIDTFCYEHNFGRGKNNQTYMDLYGQRFQIETPEQLYDYIITHLGGD